MFFFKLTLRIAKVERKRWKVHVEDLVKETGIRKILILRS